MKTFNRTGKKIKKVKHFILFTFISITYSSYAQEAEWHLLPFVPKKALVDIYCVNKDTVIAVGAYGYVVRTVDGGYHWDTVFSATTNHLNKILFLNDSVGFICGDKGCIIKTVNSGLTWTNISVSSSLNFLSMSFINQDTGWIVGGNGVPIYGLYGDKGILIKTCDGGENWEIDTTYNFIISSVYFLDKDTGYITINSQWGNFILKTLNGGLTFDTIQKNTKILYYGIYNIEFINPKTGYCLISDNGEGIYKTDDYGATWHKIVGLYYPIVDMEIIDSCNLYYINWDNTMGSYDTKPFIGINYCDSLSFNEQDFGFFAFDFLTQDYGFCIEDVGSNIYKLGEYDAIKEIEKSETVKIFPNPCTGKSTLIFTASLNVENLDIVVCNTLGQAINADIQVNHQEIQIDLSTEKSGVYIVCIKDKNKLIQTCKLIKL